MALSSHFPLPKMLHSSKQFAFFVNFPLLSNGVTRGSKQQNNRSNFAAPSFFSSKQWIKLMPKTIGNRKRDCAWGCTRGMNTTWENLQIGKHKSGRRSGIPLTELICAFRSADFLRWCFSPKRNLTHNLFSYFQEFLVLILIWRIFQTHLYMYKVRFDTSWVPTRWQIKTSGTLKGCFLLHLIKL